MRHLILIAISTLIASPLFAKVTNKELRLIQRLDKFETKFCTSPATNYAASCAELKGEVAHLKNIVEQMNEGTTTKEEVKAQVKNIRKIVKQIRKGKKVAKFQMKQQKIKKHQKNKEIKEFAASNSSEGLIRSHGARTKVAERAPASSDNMKIQINWDANRIRPAFGDSTGVN